MKHAFIKGFKAWNNGNRGSDCPYKRGEDKREKQWLSGFISGMIAEESMGKRARRIPKA